MTYKILELFGGIGAPRKALVNLGIEHKSIDYVEILPYAVTAYNQMFDNGYKPQDVKDWNMHVDILVHGSPCQDWSKNGLNNMKTGRSILYERTIEIIKHELTPRPRIVIWENVTGLISKRHISHFEHYLHEMESMGYTNSFKVLNSKDYGVPQNRERIFTISVLGNESFDFPDEIPLIRSLQDYLDFNVPIDEYLLSDNEKQLFFEQDGKLFVRENNKRGYKEVKEFDAINVERPNSKTRRGRVGNQMVQTITTNCNQVVYYDGILRRITPKESWRLMGFSDDDFNNVLAKEIPNRMLYQLAGNSIVVDVLEAIFKVLLKTKEEVCA